LTFIRFGNAFTLTLFCTWLYKPNMSRMFHNPFGPSRATPDATSTHILGDMLHTRPCPALSSFDIFTHGANRNRDRRGHGWPRHCPGALKALHQRRVDRKGPATVSAGAVCCRNLAHGCQSTSWCFPGELHAHMQHKITQGYRGCVRAVQLSSPMHCNQLCCCDGLLCSTIKSML
jgi:hypothetical protein